MSCIPYMGSKRKTANKYFDIIQKENPNSKIIYDLFAGGFAITAYFYKCGWDVVANDKNKYVVALFDYIFNQQGNLDIFTKFVTRKEFFDVLKNPDNYDDYWVGYVMTCLSFGNDQSSYLYGKDMEPTKLAGHKLVVDKDISLIKEMLPGLDFSSVLEVDGLHPRRSSLRNLAVKLFRELYHEKFKVDIKNKDERYATFKKYVKGLKEKVKNGEKGCDDLVKLKGLEKLEQLQRLERLQHLERLEHLQRLEKLQQLNNLDTLQTLTNQEIPLFTNSNKIKLFAKSYDEIDIPKDVVIYCDPPYKGTYEYSEGGFDHEKFWLWVKQKSKTNPVYISEYQAPDDFVSVLSYHRKSTLQGGNQQHTNQPNECLFRIIDSNTKT